MARGTTKPSVKRRSSGPRRIVGSDTQVVLLRDLFASILLLQGVPQRNVAKVVAVDLNRVTRIAKDLRARHK